MGSGSGGVMCFARLVLGADTAIDSSRGRKNSTLVGDDMMAVSAAAWPTVPLSGGTVQAAAAED